MSSLLKQFEQEENIRVRLEMIPWSMGWQRLVEVGLYHAGPDVSEIGSTWILDFVRMNALRAFTPEEVKAIAPEKQYFSAAVAGGKGSDGTTWALPLGGDARAIFYRRDLLGNAGVDENKAFNTPSQFQNTLELLQKIGGTAPLMMQTGRSRNSIHSVASWVWGLGGDFLTPDGLKLQLDNPRTMEGFKAYFSLGRYLGTQRIMEEYDSDSAFLQGRAATTISGYWILHESCAPEVEKNLWLAAMPGVPFVGGEHLVIWRSSRRQEAALRLIRFLNRSESSQLLHPHFGLPVSATDWPRPPFDRPEYDVFLKAMETGRCFSTSPLWGLVEKRLSEILPDIWSEVLAQPDQVDTIVEKHLSTLSKRLETALRA